MHGPLSEIGVIEVLQLLERGERSGILRLSRGDTDDTCTLSLARGTVVSVEPAAGDAAVDAALRTRRLTDGPDDVALVDASVSDATRAELALDAVRDTMEWRRGRFDFSAGPPARGPLQLAPEAVIFSVVGAEAQRAELAESFGGFDAVPVLIASAADDTVPMPALTARDWRVLDQVDGQRTVDAISRALGESVDLVSLSIQQWRRAAIIELRAPPASSDTAQDAASFPVEGFRHTRV